MACSATRALVAAASFIWVNCASSPPESGVFGNSAGLFLFWRSGSCGNSPCPKPSRSSCISRSSSSSSEGEKKPNRAAGWTVPPWPFRARTESLLADPLGSISKFIFCIRLLLSAAILDLTSASVAFSSFCFMISSRNWSSAVYAALPLLLAPDCFIVACFRSNNLTLSPHTFPVIGTLAKSKNLLALHCLATSSNACSWFLNSLPPTPAVKALADMVHCNIYANAEGDKMPQVNWVFATGSATGSATGTCATGSASGSSSIAS
mmetsp:Transcript_54489/g.124168  ORF Transcript_54489/g.124168 Transcript_54489/m.124168 type:complete len:264 (+) Transcript_54489:186-977(+)